MSSLHSGQWRCLRGRPGFVALTAAAWILLAPAAAAPQDSREFILPDLDSDLLLMAEVVEVQSQVTFVEPTAIGAINDLKIGIPGQNLTAVNTVTVAPDSAEGGTKRGGAKKDIPQTAASLSVASAPGKSITIAVDKVVAGDGISLADFRCNYNARGDTACDGHGYSETSVAKGTLMVGVTLIGQSQAMVGSAIGSFDVTISYQ